jgi:Bacterial inner membrane protein
MQTRETALRAWLLASTPFWMAHDLGLGSLPGLIADVPATAAAMLLKLSPAILSETISLLKQVRLANERTGVAARRGHNDWFALIVSCGRCIRRGPSWCSSSGSRMDDPHR